MGSTITESAAARKAAADLRSGATARAAAAAYERMERASWHADAPQMTDQDRDHKARGFRYAVKAGFSALCYTTTRAEADKAAEKLKKAGKIGVRVTDMRAVGATTNPSRRTSREDLSAWLDRYRYNEEHNNHSANARMVVDLVGTEGDLYAAVAAELMRKRSGRLPNEAHLKLQQLSEKLWPRVLDLLAAQGLQYSPVPIRRNPEPPRWVRTPAERKAWSDAEALARKQGMGDNYGYVTRIAQSLLGMKKRAKGSKRKGKMAAARKMRGGGLKGAARAAHAGKVKRDKRGRIVKVE